MTKREDESWKKFCETGLVSDYLEYRSAVEFGQKAPGLPDAEGVAHADIHRSGGGPGEGPGRAG